MRVTIRGLLSDAGWKARVAEMLPPDITEQIPLDPHGSKQGRVYVHALRNAGLPGDPRVGPSVTFGKDWLPGVHEWQLQQLARASRDIQRR